jgi:hypothetical protein
MEEQEADDQIHAIETISYIAWEPSAGVIDGLAFEVGRTANAVTHESHTIPFQSAFAQPPALLADMQTTDGGDTANLRWANKSKSSVDVWIDEAQSRDDEVSHTTEVVGYLLIGAYNPPDCELKMQLGQVDIDQEWQRVAIDAGFCDPVIVAKPMSTNDDEPAVVRVRNVDTDGFEIRLQEWDYLDGFHDLETVSFLVMERGSHTLPSGTRVEAEHLATNTTASFDAVRFNRPFGTKPVVVAAVTTFNEDDASAVTTRVREVSTGGFEAGLREEELNAQTHSVETISYVAWEPSAGWFDNMQFEVGRTANAVTHVPYTVGFQSSFSSPPALIADMQTTDGGDTANLRWDNETGVSIDLWVAEEQSRDTEITHTSEEIGYMLFLGR